MTLTGEMISFSDYLYIMVLLFFICVIATLVLEIVNFVPSFMVSLVKSIRNKSMIEQNDLLKDSLTPSLDPDKTLTSKLESKLTPTLESTINPGQQLRK